MGRIGSQGSGRGTLDDDPVVVDGGHSADGRFHRQVLRIPGRLPRRRAARSHRPFVLGRRSVLLSAHHRADVLRGAAREWPDDHDSVAADHDRAHPRGSCHHLARPLPPADPRPGQQRGAPADGVTGVSPAPIGVVFEDAELERSVRSGLDEVETGLRTAVRSDNEILDISARHLVDAGGKRFRPLLTLLSSHFGDPSAPEIITAGVVVELTHLATLYHDDVMDEAVVRRGATSANSRWGNTVAILTGDFLFARASDILADLGPEAVRLQARTFERLVQGQIRETVGPEEHEDPVEHYLRVVGDKTGSLIGTSGRFGAMLSGAPDSA